jgi:hypothetical protein
MANSDAEIKIGIDEKYFQEQVEGIAEQFQKIFRKKFTSGDIETELGKGLGSVINRLEKKVDTNPRSEAGKERHLKDQFRLMKAKELQSKFDRLTLQVLKGTEQQNTKDVYGFNPRIEDLLHFDRDRTVVLQQSLGEQLKQLDLEKGVLSKEQSYAAYSRARKLKRKRLAGMRDIAENKNLYNAMLGVKFAAIDDMLKAPVLKGGAMKEYTKRSQFVQNEDIDYWRKEYNNEKIHKREEEKKTDEYRKDVSSALKGLLKYAVIGGVGALYGMASRGTERELKNDLLLNFAPQTNYERLKRIHTAFKRAGINEDQTNNILSNLYRLYMQYQQTGKAPASAHLLGLDVFRDDPTAMVDLIMKGYKQQGKEFFKNQILTDFFSGFESNVKMAFENVIKAGGSSEYWDKRAKELAESGMTEKEKSELKVLRTSLTDLTRSFGGLFDSIATSVSPSIRELADSLTEANLKIQKAFRSSFWDGFLKTGEYIEKGFQWITTKSWAEPLGNTIGDFLYNYKKDKPNWVEVGNLWDSEDVLTSKAIGQTGGIGHIIESIKREPIVLNIVNKTGNNLDITTENQSEIDFIKNGF